MACISNLYKKTQSRWKHTLVRFLHNTSCNQSVRVRFAPSPTGFLHIGGLRTALYNFLFAKCHKNGKFVIRIEDTDQGRAVPGATEHLLSTLNWIGIEPDESPVHGGDYGPYFQSQRLFFYSKYADELIKLGAAYRCFCSSQRLMLLKKDQLQRKENPKYDNRCRHLSHVEIDENLSQEKSFVVRLKLENRFHEFNDALYGDIKHDVGGEGDPVLLKSDGYPTYHLANVIDDHLMEISHVIRGREWLVSTPKHVLLYEALGWTPPQYMHLPLLVNPDGTKLSKRQNDINVEYLKQEGFSQMALINFMVYCGSGFPDVTLPISAKNESVLLKNLTSSFKPDTLLLSDAVVDSNKLDEFSRTLTSQLIDEGNPNQLRRMVNDLFDLVLKNYGHDCIFHDLHYNSVDVWNYLISIIKIRKGHIDKLHDLASTEYEYLWKRPTINENLDPTFSNVFADTITYLQEINWNALKPSEVNKKLSSIAKSQQVHYPSLMKFLRTALIGKEEGPKIMDIIAMFGKRETICRLSHVRKQLNEVS